MTLLIFLFVTSVWADSAYTSTRLIVIHSNIYIMNHEEEIPYLAGNFGKHEIWQFGSQVVSTNLYLMLSVIGTQALIQ